MSLTRADKEKETIHSPITFLRIEAYGVIHPHKAVRIINLSVANYNCERVLVDTGSSIDILYNRMGLNMRHLRLINIPLYRFTEERVDALRIIMLLVTFKDKVSLDSFLNLQ